METEESNHTAVAHRHRNADWTNAHNQQLVDGLRAGLTVDQLAADLDRTPGAIRSRAKLLVPPDAPRARGQYAIDVLRELLDDPDCPWESALAESLKDFGRRYWSAADTERLRSAWDAAVPLPELAEEFDVDEPQLIRQLMSLGLGRNRTEIVDRLGCAPGGQVDLWRRLTADRAAAEVWVLTIHGLPAEPAHVSVHPSAEDAASLRDELLVPATTTGTGAASVWWCIASRSPGFVGGETTSGRVTVST
ncbi:hypothetical protein [Kribbella sp.]|uniref:hypothetical protein n=1 Tax=Kribbella sp. TaxID=1871183 RepID=UPI002D5956E3|nr:hypothetical protein [Kribbella sp.]HZX03867.1 hypothetical protein [Kribbella sp.]